MERESRVSDLPDEWRKTWFENAHAEVRWSKEQGWRVLEGSVLLLGGIVAASLSISEFSVVWVAVMVVVVVGFAILYMVDLHRSANKSRRWCAEILPNGPGPARTFDRDHLFYLLGRIVIVLVAGTLSLWIAALQQRPAPAQAAIPIEWRGFFYDNPTNMQGTPITKARLAASPRFATLQECSAWGVRETASNPRSGFQCGYNCRPADSAIVDDTVCKDATSVIAPR